MKRVDAVARWLAGGAAVLVVGAAWCLVPPTRPALRPARGGAWAARGCIDPEVATAADWRALPGVSAKASERLASACRIVDCRVSVPPVRGVGPVLRGRIVAGLCRQAR